jgi:hypothetical protein
MARVGWWRATTRPCRVLQKLYRLPQGARRKPAQCKAGPARVDCVKRPHVIQSVNRTFVPIKRQPKALGHSRPLTFSRLVANRARHSRAAALARVWMIAPRSVSVLFANPSGVTASLAWHGVNAFGSRAIVAAGAVSEIVQLRSRVRSLHPLRERIQ